MTRSEPRLARCLHFLTATVKNSRQRVIGGLPTVASIDHWGSSLTVHLAPASSPGSVFELGPRLLHEAFHRTLSPMVITDTTVQICHVNPAFEQATGYTLSELRGKQPTVMHSRMQRSEEHTSELQSQSNLVC